MTKSIGVAEIKRQFSQVVSEVSLKGKHFIIEKKGKPMVALVNIKELELIESHEKEENEKRGLLATIGAWEDFDGFETVIKDIYKKRKKIKDRKIESIN